MDSSFDFSTLVELLQERARTLPDQRAYTILDEKERESIHVTYGQLDREARAIGARLQSVHAGGERVLLLYPDGLEYVTGFFGCLYAGAVPIPAYPPRLGRPNLRIQAIAADAGARSALTTTSIATKLDAQRERTSELQALRYLGTTYPEPGEYAEAWDEPPLAGDSLAYIQYTSGSTATPRGVMLSHRNLLDNLAHFQHALKIRPSEVGVSWLPLYHDMGLIGGVLLALYVGGPLAMMSSTSFAQAPLRWLQAITRHKATVSGGPNFAYQLCVDRITAEERAALDLSSWQVALCGAEPIRADTLHRFAEVFAPCGFRLEAFRPGYGLAEATLLVSAKAAPSAPTVYRIQRSALERGLVVEQDGDGQPVRTFVGCGQSLQDHQVAIVDPESLRRCPPDRVGEIWFSGPSVAQGYWNRPEETSRTFQAFIAGTGEGPYLRTGDLGFLKNGELVITGRLKDLIIIRGLNYDPHDIEVVAEQSHPALEPGGGAAFSLHVAAEERLAIVHELRRSQRNVDAEEVSRAIRHAVAENQELPVYAVALCRPGAIPRTSSGKIQRYLCREAFLAGHLETIAVDMLPSRGHATEHGDQSTFVAPRTPLEMALAGICATTLGRERIGIYDNFFELGGDSLIAAQVASRLREMLHVELSLRSFLETPTIAGLAIQVQGMLRKEAMSSIPPLKPVGWDGPLPLSFAQERMWFIYQLDPQSPAYNICSALRLVGRLDREALQHTFDEIVRRHEAFRTTFTAVDGHPVQVVAPRSMSSVAVIDLRTLRSHERESRAMQLAEEEARQPFDLTRGPLLRVSLLQLGDEDHILLFNMHHIISDAWSLGLLTGEMLKLYNAHVCGETVRLPPLTVQYTDFAVWQRQWLRGEALEALLAYWRKQLDGVPALELPTDRPRPVMQRYRGALVSSDIPPELMNALKRLSSQEGVTLFMTLLAAFEVLLCRYTGQEDVAVAVPVANRNWYATEGVVGSFVNTLVMRADLSGNPTFGQLLQRVREVALGAYAHQDMPYAKLVAELQPERDASRAPLAQVMFDVINVPIPSLELKDLHATPLEVDRHGAQFDLNLTVTDTEVLQQVSIEYDTDLFGGDTIRRMLEHLLILWRGLLADPDQRISYLPLLTDAEVQQLIVSWNDTAAAYPRDACIHHLFEEQARRRPHAVALRFEDQELTYQELDQRADQLACYLQQHGAGPETLVGLCVERSPAMVVGLLGVLKAGAGYLPLDPTYPQERLAFMLEQTQVLILLTQERLAADLPTDHAQVVCLDADWGAIAQEHGGELHHDVTPENVAYVIYTSGSTDKPKGVVISHRAVVNFLKSMQREPGLRDEDILLSVTSLSFDIAVLELFLPLSVGARVELASRGTALDGQQLSVRLARTDATVMQATPVTWRLLVEAGWQGNPQLKALCGGEALPRDLADELLARCGSLWNMYGPTETTVWSTLSRVEVGKPITIGRPIGNTQVYILDHHLQPVPFGVTGELYIGGLGLARGYFSDPELTAERFIRDPFSDVPTARLYKTGDLARYLSDGLIEWLGRRDGQVKIRGFRIELGEIETALRQHPAVAEAAAIALGGYDGGPFSPEITDRRLVAYVVPKGDRAPSIEELRAFLADRLPAYMIPAAFALVDALPLTPNGKLDRRALGKLGQVQAKDTDHLVSPRDALERQMVHIWEQVLDMRSVGLQDNFFELGGHSLLAVRLFTRIEEMMNVTLPVAILFRSPTVEQLCEAIRASRSPDWDTVVPIQAEGSQPPLFCVHGLGGGVLGYADLAGLLGGDQPFYGLQARGLDGAKPPHTRMEEMAAGYIEAIRTVQPTGPYRLGGYSFGGVVAFQMARQLQEQGARVELLALFDTYAPLPPGVESQLWRPLVLASFLRNLPRWLGDILRRKDGAGRLLARVRLAARGAWPWANHSESAPLTDAVALDIIGDRSDLSEERRRVLKAHLEALESYRPGIYPGHVTLFRVPGMRLLRASDDTLGWGRLAAGGVTIRNIAGAHYSILQRPAVEALAAQLRASLAEIRGG